MAVPMALLSPMWQRIARGEVDLSVYTDDEILSGEIRMADGRLLPAPKEIPETMVREQIARGLRKAERQIRKNALLALEVYEEIMLDDTVEPRDRLKAADFFTTRFLGKDVQHVHVTTEDGPDAARERLTERLLAARMGLPAPVVTQLAASQVVDDAETFDAELVDDATLTLEDLL